MIGSPWCSIENLSLAWDEVRSADERDGELSASVTRFSADAGSRIAGLHERLMSGNWTPGPLHPVTIAKESGGTRELHVPEARDRLVERAMLRHLTPLIDRWFTPWSFAYRPGTGVTQALAALAQLRDDGARVVVRADIADCFDHIRHDGVLAALTERGIDGHTRSIVRLLLQRRVAGEAQRRTTTGVPQGGPLSPLLANLYLDRFDREVASEGWTVIRYADDLIAPCSDPREGAEALRAIARSLDRMGLRLGTEKTTMDTFDDGFTFLGSDVNLRYPTGDPQLARPNALTLHVGRQGAYVRLRDGRIQVLDDDHEILSVPSGHIGRIVTAGSVLLAPGARSWALTSGVDITICSRRGTYLGIIRSPEGNNPALRRRQCHLTEDDEFCLALASTCVTGKLANQRALLLRFNRRIRASEVASAADEIERLAAMTRDVGDRDELLGIEGFGARRYFETWDVLFDAEAHHFEGRSAHPPGDVVNAALSYGYGMLRGEAESACHAAGLDPAWGFMHRDRRRRPSLALDLMEEFRPIVVDGAVLELARRGRLADAARPAPDGRGVLLTERARREVVAAVERRLLTVAHHPSTGRRVPWRVAVRLQAEELAGAFSTGQPEYRTVVWR